MSKFKPCLFCGETEIIFDEVDYDFESYKCSIKCSTCGVMFSHHVIDKEADYSDNINKIRSIAKRLWNKRKKLDS